MNDNRHTGIIIKLGSVKRAERVEMMLLEFTPLSLTDNLHVKTKAWISTLKSASDRKTVMS